jgi:hypothetical protein
MSVGDSSQPPDDHPDLPARIDAAAALRRLAHAMIAHRVDVACLHRVADAADRLTAEIEAAPERTRGEELVASPRFAAAAGGGSLAQLMEDGSFVDLFHDSPVSGSASPLSIGLRIRREGEEAIGTVVLAAGWEGAPGRGHGGVVAACVDETIGGLLPILGTMAFTGRLSLHYVAPCPMHVPIEFRARLDSREGRKLHISCTGTGPEGLFVTATSLFIAVDFDLLGAFVDTDSD